MKLDEKAQAMREEALRLGREPVPSTLQGVTKERVTDVLRLLERASEDSVDAVFALLDDRPSWFPRVPAGTRFCDGASTAHVACHIGILQRGGTKLDREGRDYWIKPLREIGAIEAVLFDGKNRTFVAGHPVAKSPNSAYRLDPDFVRVLTMSEWEWEVQIKNWIQDDRTRVRLAFQAQQAAAAVGSVRMVHADLIAACCSVYAPRFLPGFRILYVDDADGARVSDDEERQLRAAGLGLELRDAMPDVLLWNPATDALWVIEAVTSDGEVDQHKVDQLRAFAKRHGKPAIDFTTAYATWRAAAQRQGAHKNLAVGTYVWIVEDASKQFLAGSFPTG